MLLLTAPPEFSPQYTDVSAERRHESRKQGRGLCTRFLQKIMAGKYDIPEDVAVSPECQHMLRRLLTVRPATASPLPP